MLAVALLFGGTAAWAQTGRGEGGPLMYAAGVQSQGGGGRTEVQVDAQTGNVVRTLPANQEDADDGD